MAVALLLAVVNSALSKLASFHGDLSTEHTGVPLPAKTHLREMEKSLTQVFAILRDGVSEFPLENLNIVVYDIDDLLDEIVTDVRQKMVNKGNLLQQVKNSLSTSSYSSNRQIKDLRKKLDAIVSKNKVRFENYAAEGLAIIKQSSLDEYQCDYMRGKSDIVIGRDNDKQEIINRLSSASNAKRLSVLPIVGLGGIGKTTLAKLVYHDDWVSANFDFKLWISFMEEFDKRKIMECIVNAVYEDAASDLSPERLEQRLIDATHGKKYFLVLDNARAVDSQAWYQLANMLDTVRGGSVILVTTRIRETASVCGTVAPYALQGLTVDACWYLFSRLVFEETEREKYPNLVQIGRSYVERCSGVPLHVKLLGGMLCRTRDEQEWWKITGIVIDKGEVLGKAYKMLPCHFKACFAYSFMCLKDTEIYSSHLINCWRAQGLLQEISSKEMEDHGYKCLNELLMKSFLQDAAYLFNNRAGCVKLHDVVYDWANWRVGVEMAVVGSHESLISKTTKHVIWRNLNESLFAKKFPGELSQAKRLRTLKFDGKVRHISRSFLERLISTFKKIRVLDISNCYVQELPNSIGELKHLRLLDLSGNCAIKGLPSTICKLYNLQTLNLDGCEQLEKLPGGMQKLLNIGFLSITSKQSTLISMKLNELSSLQHLELSSCWGLTSLWADDEHLSSLKKLLIFNCQMLVSFPSSMNYLIHLEELVIHNCPELNLIEGKGLCGLKSLRSLEIIGIQKMVELPTELSSATALQYLMISDCQSLRSLARSLPNLTSLRRLCIYDCPNLLMLPEELCSITALQLLDIRQCPWLSRGLSRNRARWWRLISHIPEIIVNGRWLQVLSQLGRESTEASSLVISNQYLPRSLSYFSLKLTPTQAKYSEGKGMEEDRLLEPILPSRWEALSLAFRAIVRMRTMVKGKHRIKFSDDGLFEQKSILQKHSKWQVLSLVLGAIVRMRTMARERYLSIELSELPDAQLEMMLHCCLFDNNYEFERGKLVQLWIAAKFLKNEPLEDEGQRFFDFLLEKNYIFLSKVDILTRVSMYKVNLEELNGTFTLMPRIKDFQMRLEDGNMTANRFGDSLHISVLSGNIDQVTFEKLKNFRELRTLLFLSCSSIKQVPSDMFLALKFLTSLDLSGSCIAEIPSSIGDMKELCYVDLSQTPIKRLPQSIACLQKLQTLRLIGCVHLFLLPNGIKELVNLRHLDFDVLGQLNSMPRGIGALIQLRTLPAFIVNDYESCNIRELKHMNNLSGRLCISGLEHVVNSEDAKDASFTNKECLKQLELRWSDIVQFHENEEQSFNRVLEYLQPSSCLKEVQITCFPGSMLPTWIGDPRYTNLVSITLFKCENCRNLPSLGQLLKLKNLDIIEMNSIKIIDDLFCGADMDHAAFPMLEMLAIDGMLSLEAWMGFIYGECPCLVKLSMKRCPHLRAIHSFPHLRSLKHLEVTHCPLLECLPEEMLSSPLETLAISASPLLEKRYSEEGEELSKLKHVSNVWIDSEDTQSSDDDASEDYISIAGNDFNLEEIQSTYENTVEDDISIARDGNPSSTTFSVISSVPGTPMSKGMILQSHDLKIFSFSDLQKATQKFRPRFVLGGGASGTVFEGWIDEHSYAATKPGKGMAVAVKRLTLDKNQDYAMCLRKVNYLGKLYHPHLVKLIGYCLDDKNFVLVYEFMPRGSLDNHLFRRSSHLESLSWNLRMKAALGAAKGLAFLHSAHVIHWDFKTSHVLLDSNHNAKLCGFGLSRDGPTGDTSHVSTQVMGTLGYAAPEYVATGHDVYSFGVVLLEMLSGRRAFDAQRPLEKRNLVDWAQPFLTNKKKLLKIIDSRLMKQCPHLDTVFKVCTLASRCLSHVPKLRPTMEEVVKELEQQLHPYTEKVKSIVV